jgi:D-3-phosphoglycerate dehydrogenase
LIGCAGHAGCASDASGASAAADSATPAAITARRPAEFENAFIDCSGVIMMPGSQCNRATAVPRIFLTHTADARANYYGDDALAGLRRSGDVVLNESGRPLSTSEVIAVARDCDIIVSDRQTRGDAEIFRSLPKLVAFSRVAVDIRNVDVAAASGAGVLVTRASAGFMGAVSEWIIGVMIDLSRNISASVVEYRAGRMPVPRMGRELRGSTIGIAGYGQIGRHLARMARALQMRVLVADPHAHVDEADIAHVALDALLAESDYVVCLVVATPETEKLMNADAFRAMKPTAYFINASRGELVDESALRQALDERWIAGCAMDVGRDPDQMPTFALAQHPRVIATPHSGGLTPDSVRHQAMETVRQVAEIVAGRIPAGAVNAEHASRLRSQLS